LYLVLDLCAGGELFYYISKVYGKLPESKAKLCFAQIFLALEHLHNKNVVYRDLKPENVLVDAEGHLRLTDFGLSKMNFGPDDLA
jgi:serine/threonine protein kinase